MEHTVGLVSCLFEDTGDVC